MSQQRKPKRQRKKEAQAARREAMREYTRRRQRTRRIVLAVVTIVVVGAGFGVASLVTGGDDTPVARPSPSPGASPAPVGCEADPTEEGFGKPADQQLDETKATIWRLDTSEGTIDIELDVVRAPVTANSIAFLTREGFYDGLTFHRIVSGFVVQGGDPSGDGTGGPGYTCVEPPPPDLVYEEGIVAMAKAGNEPPGASGSQFFIVSGADAASLPVEFALVGKVVAGMQAVEAIEAVELAEGGEGPAEPVTITKATIV